MVELDCGSKLNNTFYQIRVCLLLETVAFSLNSRSFRICLRFWFFASYFSFIVSAKLLHNLSTGESYWHSLFYRKTSSNLFHQLWLLCIKNKYNIVHDFAVIIMILQLSYINTVLVVYTSNYRCIILICKRY